MVKSPPAQYIMPYTSACGSCNDVFLLCFWLLSNQ